MKSVTGLSNFKDQPIIDVTEGGVVHECRIYNGKGELVNRVSKEEVLEIHQTNYTDGTCHRSMMKNPVTKICDFIECKKIFKTKDPKKKFCSIQCSRDKAGVVYKDKKKRMKAANNPPVRDVRKDKCGQCKKEYETVRSNQKYCSLKCKLIKNNKIKNEKRKTTRRAVRARKLMLTKRKVDRIALELKGKGGSVK